MENIANQQNSIKKSWYNAKLNDDVFVHFFCFLSVLFIGADLFGVNVGVNLRVDQIFLVVLGVLLISKDKLKITRNRWIALFAVSSLISALFAFDIKRGILFFCSIIYNIIFVFYLFSCYVKTYGLKKFIDIFRKTCYVQFAIFLLQYVLMVVFGYEFSFLPNYGYYFGIPRFRLWFYEPSYLANYMTLWFVISAYMFLIGKDKSYLKDVILCALMLILSTSTTGILGLVFTVAVVYFIWLSKGLNLKKLSFLIAVFVIFIVLYLIFKDIFDVFIGRIFTGSLDEASGGRISKWSETFEVFKDNPLFGVGPGNYGLYLGEEAGYVPSNITLEIMATLGIFATVAYYGLTLSLVFRSYKLNKKLRDGESGLLAACALGLIIFTLILQVNQGYLRLYHWMMFGILQGGIYCLERRTKIQK